MSFYFDWKWIKSTCFSEELSIVIDFLPKILKHKRRITKEERWRKVEKLERNSINNFPLFFLTEFSDDEFFTSWSYWFFSPRFHIVMIQILGLFIFISIVVHWKRKGCVIKCPRYRTFLSMFGRYLLYWRMRVLNTQSQESLQKNKNKMWTI